MATKTTKSTAKKTTRRRSKTKKKSGDRGITIKGKNNR